MNQNYSYNYPMNYNPNNYNNSSYSSNDDRFLAGGLAFPFLLGGVTGAALAPAFWRPGYSPYYRPYYQPYPPYPYYGPYYR